MASTPGPYSGTLAEQVAQNLASATAPNSPLNPGVLGSSGGYAPPSFVEQAAEQAATGKTKMFPLLSAFKNFANPAMPEYGASALGTALLPTVVPAAGYAGAHLAGNLLRGTSFGKDYPGAGSAVSSIGSGMAIGAGLGLAGGPLTPLSVPAGILGGGIAGAGAWLLGKHGGQTSTERWNQNLNMLIQRKNEAFDNLKQWGVSPDVVEGVRQEYDSLLNNKNPINLAKGDVNPYTGQVLTGPLTLSGTDASHARAFNYLSQVEQTQQKNAPPLPGLEDATAAATGMNPKQMLALQEQTTQLMAPYMADIQKQGNAEIANWAQAATPLGQHISAATQSLANVYKGSLGKVNDAYILQAQGTPFLNALASTQYNAGVKAQQQSAAGSSGGSGLAALLQASPSPQANIGSPALATNYGASPLLIQ